MELIQAQDTTCGLAVNSTVPSVQNPKFRQFAVLTQENAVDVHSLGTVPNTHDDGREGGLRRIDYAKNTIPSLHYFCL